MYSAAARRVGAFAPPCSDSCCDAAARANDVTGVSGTGSASGGVVFSQRSPHLKIMSEILSARVCVCRMVSPHAEYAATYSRRVSIAASAVVGADLRPFIAT